MLSWVFFSCLASRKNPPPLLRHNHIPGLSELTDTRHSRMAGIRTVIPQQYNKSSDDAQVLNWEAKFVGFCQGSSAPPSPPTIDHGIEIPVLWLDKWAVWSKVPPKIKVQLQGLSALHPTKKTRASSSKESISASFNDLPVESLGTSQSSEFRCVDDLLIPHHSFCIIPLSFSTKKSPNY